MGHEVGFLNGGLCVRTDAALPVAVRAHWADDIEEVSRHRKKGVSIGEGAAEEGVKPGQLV